MRVEGSKIRWARGQGAVIAAVALAACAHGTNLDIADTTGAGGNLTVSTSGAGDGTTTSSNATSSSDTTTSSDASTSASSTSSTTASSTSASTSASTSTSSSASSTASTTTSSASASTSSGGPTSSFKVQYLAKNTTATAQQINFYLEVFNTGSASVPLSDLTVRYWFTADGWSSPLQFNCDYTAISGGCVNIAGSFGAASAATADHYLEVGFTSAAIKLNPGAKSGEIQLRIHTGSFDTLTQTNDYSFDPAKTSYQDAPKVTLYESGTLVWGTEP